MYKLLLFLNKTNEENIINHFKDFTLKYLSNVLKQEIKIGTVESNLLLEQKYSLFIEVSVKSNEEWISLMASKDGREFNKDLMEFYKHITPIFISYS